MDIQIRTNTVDLGGVMEIALDNVKRMLKEVYPHDSISFGYSETVPVNDQYPIGSLIVITAEPKAPEAILSHIEHVIPHDVRAFIHGETVRVYLKP